MIIEKRLLSVAEVAIYLGLRKSTIYQWAETRKIPFLKLGRLTKFDKREIDKFIDRSRVNPVS